MSRKLVIGIAALIIIACTIDLAAQTTVAAANGSWALGSNWIGGTAPGFTGLGGTNITVNTTSPKYIQVGAYGANQDLTFAANNDARSITVNGTLVVYGNVNFANMAMDLRIPAGGVVIILGDLDMNNKIDLSLGGTLVVKGDFGKTGSQGSFTGSGGVYVGSYSGDADDLIPTGNEFLVNPDLINNPALQYIEDFLNNNGQFPLPVELLSFTAEQSGEEIVLDWSTASELNFNYFSLERSLNGKNFIEIARVDGHGTTKERHDYSFNDKNPQVGKNYYRLKSVDFDGYVEYFNVIMEDYSGKKVFSIYPNPSDGATLTYNMNFSPDENSTIVVYDNLGVKVGSTSELDQNNNLTFLNPLNSGVYYVKIVSGNFSTIERLVVR
jgi:hypothetical protein